METICGIVALAFALVMPFDWYLVSTGRRSISVATWLAETAHPTLIVGVLIVGAALFYLTLAWWGLAFVVALATGHLVTSEGAAAAVSKKGRWQKWNR
jgi:hypothetical protein